MEVAPSPKVQRREGVPAQLDGVAVALKATVRGAEPEVGAAEALQETVQGSTAATVPVRVQL